VSTIATSGPPPVDSWPPRACKGVDPSVFFPGDGPGRMRAQEERMAKAFCHRCLAKEDCAAYAVPIVDLAGVWAEMNANQRVKARKKEA
jgi:hypothetical protein